MKFKLKELIENREDIVGHLFLHTINSEFANKHKANNKEEYEQKEIQIRLLINEEEFDIRPWLEHFRERYYSYLKKEAQEILANKLSDRIDDISNELEVLRSKINSVESSIDWNEVLYK